MIDDENLSKGWFLFWGFSADMKRAKVVCGGTRVRSCSRARADGEGDLEPTVLKTPFVRIKRMVVRVT